MRYRTWLWGVLIFGASSMAFGQESLSIWTPDKDWQTYRTCFLQQGDSFAISIPAGFWLLQLSPSDSSYDNLPEIIPINYLADIIIEGPDTMYFYASELGITYFTAWPTSVLIEPNTNLQPTTQIRVRRDNSYLGYLTEMMGVPFVLPPRRLPDGHHQTDLGLGVDCAELAIYGRRRMGYQIPYVGPQRIYDYLRPIPKDSLFEGCVLHFGEQVSVLYEDLGRKGQLGPEDLLIQSYETWVKVVSWQESGWFRREWKAFDWR